MSRIAEMTTSAVTNRVKGGQIKRGGKERTHVVLCQEKVQIKCNQFSLF